MEFVKLLQVHDDVLDEWLEAWSTQDATRKRLIMQAAVALDTVSRVHTRHADLIRECVDRYAPRFLPNFEVLFTDANDGDRITRSERAALSRAGLSLEIGDAIPDVILWNPASDEIWIIEAVISDGEVDLHKLRAVKNWGARNAKRIAGCTTAYATWKAAAARQGSHKNLAPDTYLWVREDPGRQFLICLPDAN